MAEYRGKTVDLLASDAARALYDKVEGLPIVDYHCHLSPQEIFEDKPFEDIGGMWLGGDHYKWRLMRGFGVDERLITGDAPMKDKFVAFAEATGYAFGNPIKDWVQSELGFFFGIDLPLNAENAQKIWDEANAVIAANKLSPRKLMKMADVVYVATTDDPCDDLRWHEAIAADKGFDIKVAPSFRTDKLVSADKPGYAEYVRALAKAAGVDADDFDGFKMAILARMDYFKAHGCKFSDIGVEGFPASIADDAEAAKTFDKLIAGEAVSAEEVDAYKGALYLFLAKGYKARGMVMQMHLSVARNCNGKAFAEIGADAGFDCAADPVPTARVARMLDAMNSANALPETILYSLNPTAYYPLVTLAGAFRGVHIGISWWFCDHRRGMEDTLDTLGELGHIMSMVGMLTDSRSFLSYTRHDYYRQIVCNWLAKTAGGDLGRAEKVARALCYGNAKALTEGK